jgi:hypothetical protein
MPEVKKLLKPATISEIGSLLDNASDLLTPKFVNETTLLIDDVTGFLPLIQELLKAL